MSQNDLWGIADEIEVLTEWEPGGEPPSELLSDPDWVRSRLLALRFLLSEIRREGAVYDDEIGRLETQRDAVLEGLGGREVRVRDQLASYLDSVRADAESNGKTPPASMKFPHGTIRSGGGAVRAVVTDEAATLEWCRENMPDAVKVKETVLTSVLRARLAVGENRLVDASTGEVVPGVVLKRGDRWIKVDVPES